MLEELGRHIFIRRVVTRQLQCDRQHVQAVHAHPGGAVRLSQVATGWQRSRAVEDADVVQTEEATLKDIVAFGILAVHPPGEVQQQLLEDALQEAPISHTVDAFVDLVNAPGGPGVNGRIDILEAPFIGRDLSVGMHVPLAQHQDQLALGKVRVDHGQWDAVKRQVPCGVPRVLPFVRHRDDVGVV